MPHSRHNNVTLHVENRTTERNTMPDNRCVTSGGYYIPINSPAFDSIKQRYKCKNPAFVQAHALHAKGKYVAIPDEHVYACQTIPLWHQWGGGLMIPRGINLSEYGLKHIDNRFSH